MKLLEGKKIEIDYAFETAELLLRHLSTLENPFIPDADADGDGTKSASSTKFGSSSSCLKDPKCK